MSDSVILWTAAYQVPPSVGFSRQEYWSGLPFPSPGDLPNPGIEPRSPALQTDALPSEPPGNPRVPKRVTKFSDIEKVAFILERVGNQSIRPGRLKTMILKALEKKHLLLNT